MKRPPEIEHLIERIKSEPKTLGNGMMVGVHGLQLIIEYIEQLETENKELNDMIQSAEQL